jgi:flagellar basal body-associated protein FliL
MATADENHAPKQKKAGLLKNKLVLIALLVVLLGGGGAAYFFFFLSEDKSSTSKEIQVPKSVPVDSHGSSGTEAYKPSEEQLYFLEPPFFRLPTFRIPIIRQGKLFAYFHLKIEMEANSHQSFDLAKFLLPRLVDRIFSDLYVAMSNLWSVTVDPTSEAIKERIYRVCEGVLGKGKIKSIYIPQIIIDRL